MVWLNNRVEALIHFEQTPKLGPYGRFEIQALAASGQIPPQTLAALHAEHLGRPTANVGLPLIDHQPILQASKCMSVDHVISYSQPLPSNITKQISQPVIEDVHSGLGTLNPNQMVSSYGGLAGAKWSKRLNGYVAKSAATETIDYRGPDSIGVSSRK